MLWILALFGAIYVRFTVSAAALPRPDHHVGVDNFTKTDFEVHPGSLDIRAPPARTAAFPAIRSGQLIAYYIKAEMGDESFNLQLDIGSALNWVLSTAEKAEEFAHLAKYPWDEDDDCEEKEEHGFSDGTTLSGVIKDIPLVIDSVPFGSLPTFVVEKLTDPRKINSGTEMSGLIAANRDGVRWSDEDILSLNFNREGDSYIEFGDVVVDEDKATTLEAIPNSSNVWALDSEKLDFVYIDTGFSAIRLPDSVAEDYFKSNTVQRPRRSSSTWRVKCTEDLPTFIFDLFGGGQLNSNNNPDFKIPGSSLKRGPINQDREWCNTAIYSKGEGAASALGLPFIEQYITTLNGEDGTISLEEKS